MFEVASNAGTPGPAARRWRIACFCAAVPLILLAAVGLRFADRTQPEAGSPAEYRLGSIEARPFHGDEAVNALKFSALWQKGQYEYDPAEFHGPSLPFLTLPLAWVGPADSIAETDETLYRLLPAVAGTLVVAGTMMLGRGIGWPAALVAGALCALSPAMSFYSRYYIHEMLLVLFTLAAIGCGWRYAATKQLRWAIGCGAAFGLMHATKETGALAGFAMVIALPAVALMQQRGRAGSAAQSLWRRIKLRDVGLGVLAGLIVSATFFSSFFTHWRGPLDSVMTYFTWITRGAGHETPHVHPWHWYFEQMFWHRPRAGPWFPEAVIGALALVGFVAAILKKGVADRHAPLARFLAVYTLLLTAIYCLIPYKTPWSAISFLHGMILLAGLGAAALVRWMPALGPMPVRRGAQALAALVILAGAWHTAEQAMAASFVFHTDGRNPYVYAHPVRDVRRFALRARQMARHHPDGRRMAIRLIDPGNYWPIPFYLRRFPNVGYHAEPPGKISAAMVIADPELADRIEPHLAADYQREYIGLRPGVPRLVLLRRDLWNAFIDAQRRENRR